MFFHGFGVHFVSMSIVMHISDNVLIHVKLPGCCVLNCILYLLNFDISKANSTASGESEKFINLIFKSNGYGIAFVFVEYFNVGLPFFL